MDAATALEMGLVNQLVPADRLLQRARERAGSWATEGRQRCIIRDGQLEELRATNKAESARLAAAVIADPFLAALQKTAARKGQTSAAWALWLARWVRPVWARL